MVTLHEDEFLAGFKPLSMANKPLSKISDVEFKVWYSKIVKIVFRRDITSYN